MAPVIAAKKKKLQLISVGCSAKLAQKSISSSQDWELMYGSQVSATSEFNKCCELLVLDGTFSAVSESSRLRIVLVACEKSAKFGSPGWIHAPIVISATRTLRAWIILDRENWRESGAVGLRRAREMIPAAGSPY